MIMTLTRHRHVIFEWVLNVGSVVKRQSGFINGSRLKKLFEIFCKVWKLGQSGTFIDFGVGVRFVRLGFVAKERSFFSFTLPLSFDLSNPNVDEYLEDVLDMGPQFHLHQ